MAENRSSSPPLPDDQSTSIDPDDAIKDVNEAMAILHRKPFGCLARSAKYGGILLLLLTVFVYWNFFRKPPLKISRATTYITEPLTREGTRVDYFAAFEDEFYGPEIKTENNGYRLIVRALGDVTQDGQKRSTASQFYEKLGLDPEIAPSMSYIESYDFLKKYCSDEGLEETQAVEFDAKLNEPWTLDDLPMMEPWLEEIGPILDLLTEAVRHPAYRFPIVRIDENGTLVNTTSLNEVQKTRSFARMLVARANYRLGTGEIDGAIDDVITCVRLGRHTTYQGTIMDRLVGIAVEGIAPTVGVASLLERQPSKEQIRRLIDELDAIPPRIPMSRTLLAERYQSLDFLQAMAYGDKSLAELFSQWENNGSIPNTGIANLSVDWNIVMQRVNQQFDDLETGHINGPILDPRNNKLLSNLFIGARSREVAELFSILYVPALQTSIEANDRIDCVENVQRITLGMLLYEREHGTLPPAYSVDATGKPLHSWRVLLLPYLGEQELWGKLRIDEPWDSEHNRQFHDLNVFRYQCPSAELQPGQTNYSVVVGENTAFQQGVGKSLDDFGMHLILVVEREQSVCWMDPTSELPQSVALEGINQNNDGIGSPHPGGTNVGFRDGAVRFISQTIEDSKLQGLLIGTMETRDW
ncbi:hypothetical protein FF011L_01840 [Roseimaritima multifibrata]|uniref:DUF1559 domain-containing protein n=1 Tax=Roseimaritima multifibrata TaxID=1930274 RepID=A0A517M9A6_9BACT|nr:DUF1559 domain-containing protein [Roseimaritima multifibrata]QDS91454.1 hypothetical protein FF011L_01840 [Roseimaritima multifibrata]